MEQDKPIPLTLENLPALQEKHAAKIDHAVGQASDRQQERLTLFEHDPAAIAAHYTELQQKSEQLRKENLEIRKTAAAAGWTAFAATAAATGYMAMKKRISDSNLIQGLFVALASTTAAFAGNFLTEKMIGAKNREEGKEVAAAARQAYERELAVYMEDTQNKLNACKGGNCATPQLDERMQALKTLDTPIGDDAPEPGSLPSSLSIQPRNANFAAQATAEKTTANNKMALGA